jgi:transketolase N-terminal domain/subunit
VSRDKIVVGGEIKTPVTFVLSGASEKNTSGGTGCQFVSGFGGEIRIADTTKHTQVFIGGGDSMEGEVWTGHADHLGGEVVCNPSTH